MTYADDIFRTVVVLVLFAVLTTAVVTDLKSHRIPNVLLWPALSLAIMLHMTTGGSDGLFATIAGLAIGLAMLLPLYIVGGMGAGDVKLLGIVGSFLGPWGAVVAGMTTIIAGAAIGIIFIVWRCLSPILETLGAQILSPHAVGARSTLATRRPEGRKEISYMPYAPAIAVGTAAALWYINYLPRGFLGWAT